MYLDEVTLRIVFVVLSLTILFLFSTASYRRSSATYCLWWRGTITAFLAGSLLRLMPQDADQQLAGHLSTGFFVFAAALVWPGSRSLVGKTLRWWHLAAPPALGIAVVLFTAMEQSSAVWNPIVLFLIGSGFGLGALELCHTWTGGRTQSRPLLLALAACSGHFIVRSFCVVLLGPESWIVATFFGHGIGILLSTALLVVVASSMAALNNEQIVRALTAEAAIDGLTGLLHRTEFMRQAQLQLRKSQAAGQTASLIMADLDHFKNINDNFGHGVGDQVIRSFADACRKSVRSTDLVGRYGGEEFVLLLPGVGGHDAAHIADALNESFALSWEHADTFPSPTASFGIVSTSPDRETVEALVQRADTALYRAKAEGRNRSVISTEP